MGDSSAIRIREELYEVPIRKSSITFKLCHASGSSCGRVWQRFDALRVWHNRIAFNGDLDRATDVHFHIHISLTRLFFVNLLQFPIPFLKFYWKRHIIEVEQPKRSGRRNAVQPKLYRDQAQVLAVGMISAYTFGYACPLVFDTRSDTISSMRIA
jgi:hypothetical protein